MKLSCTKENLSKALSLVSGVTGKNIHLPILNNILIKADEQKAEIIATNLELAIQVAVRAKVEEVGSFTVPARTILDFVALLPDEKIDIHLQENELVVACGKTSTKIKGMSAEDFPVIPTLESGHGFLVQADDIRFGLNQVLPAVARNDIRPELAGIYWGFNLGKQDEFVMAATDSYRLAEKKISLQQGKDSVKVIVPGRAAQEIAHIVAVETESKEEKVRLLIGENQLLVSYGGAQIFTRLVEGNYPDYTQIIPKEFSVTAEVGTDLFAKEMKAAGLFTTTGVNAVSVHLDPTKKAVAVSSVSTQTGEYASVIDAEVTGAETTVLLNNRYVLDGLNSFSVPKTILQVVGADSPCVLRPQDDTSYLYIVMPIRQ